MKRPTILVADRNSRVVNLLRRELALAGYQVLTAGTVPELLPLLGRVRRPDLLVLDLELPDVLARELLPLLQSAYPELPLLLHCLPPVEGTPAPRANARCGVLEKGADSVDHLQAAIHGILPTGAPDVH